jgi:glycosyltransferase involved in cell wall biosynthesis
MHRFAGRSHEGDRADGRRIEATAPGRLGAARSEATTERNAGRVAGDEAVTRRVRRVAGRIARRVGIRRPHAAAPSPPQQSPAPEAVSEQAETGPKPEVVVEQTNFGPMVDELVARVRRNQRPYGVNPGYDLVRQHFDHYHFMFQATQIQEDPEADPIRVFLRAGAQATNNPDPNFSMQKYLQRHPESADGPERSPYLEWLKRGKAAGKIADPADGLTAMAPLLEMEPHQIVDEVVRLRSDMLERLRHGKLGEMFAKAVEIEPVIGAAWPAAVTRTSQLPLRNESVTRAVAAIYGCHQAAGFRRARLVIVTNKPRWGGGRRIEGHLAHALAQTIDPDEIVVIYTDESGAAPRGRFPDGVREVDFVSRVGGVNESIQEEALVALVRSFRADAVVNINSRLLYRAMRAYGQALSTSERLYLCFFCDEQQPLGNWEGRSLRWFYPAFDYVAGIITDSEYTREMLTEQYQLSDADRARIHVFAAPAEPDLPVATPPPADPERRPVVFWAGRLDRQKRPDIAVEVARRMPDIDFRFWGEKVLKGDPIGKLPDNVTLEGTYDYFAGLDLDGADAWLYTSAWDGVPSLLMEVAMAEVPIVASRVGGVGEVVSEADAWPIMEWEEPEAYEKALREIVADPAEARRRSHALRERLMRQRTQQAYGEHAARLLLSPAGEAVSTAEEGR